MGSRLGCADIAVSVKPASSLSRFRQELQPTNSEAEAAAKRVAGVVGVRTLSQVACPAIDEGRILISHGML